MIGMSDFMSKPKPKEDVKDDRPPVVLKQLIEMFDNAGGNKPKIRLSDGILLKRANQFSKEPGSIKIVKLASDGHEIYHGQIWRSGRLWLKSDDSTVRDEIIKFAESPQDYAKFYHSETNHCCFCGRLLTDNDENSSVELGYGPICAAKWGLPHGSRFR